MSLSIILYHSIAAYNNNSTSMSDDGTVNIKKEYVSSQLLRPRAHIKYALMWRGNTFFDYTYKVIDKDGRVDSIDDCCVSIISNSVAAPDRQPPQTHICLTAQISYILVVHPLRQRRTQPLCVFADVVFEYNSADEAFRRIYENVCSFYFASSPHQWQSHRASYVYEQASQRDIPPSPSVRNALTKNTDRNGFHSLRRFQYPFAYT